VVEDAASLRRAVVAALRERFVTVDEEPDGERALSRLRDETLPPYDLVVTDLRLPGADGLEVLRAARSRHPGGAVVVITAFSSVEAAVRAMQLGASDFLPKPFALEELEARVERAARQARLGRDVRGTAPDLEEIVGESPALRAALDLARRVAPLRSTVLVTGETGTGKELVAGAVHLLSPRAAGPFVKVNCAALPETLLESELFGHERGAFTGAERTRIGRFEQANRGTLFLDEIGDMSPATQAKLLRVLQHQEFHRLGGTRPLRTDARIVAATNRNLEEAIAAGGFRQDLYFRLNVIGIHLPPLRERPEDVLALAEHFRARMAAEIGRPLGGFSEGALQRLRGHDWPGNVRELRNVVERAVLMSEGGCIQHVDLGPVERAPGPGPLEDLTLEEAERQLVLAALERSHFVQKDAAAHLGVSRRKLNYKIRRLGITHPSWRRNRSKGERETRSTDAQQKRPD
jgi:DNA-binding NtrC family response regulator